MIIVKSKLLSIWNCKAAHSGHVGVRITDTEIYGLVKVKKFENRVHGGWKQDLFRSYITVNIIISLSTYLQ